MQVVSLSSPKLTTRNLVYLAMLMAMALVLGRFSVGNDWIKISPAFIATGLMGYYFGPWLAALAAALNDQIAYMLWGSGGNFLGFTLSAAVGALIYGLFFHKKAVTLWRVIVATVLVVGIVNVGLDTLWLVMMGFKLQVIIWPRVIKNLVVLPVQAALLYTVLKAVVRVRPRLERN
ncbi:MAG: folate family ECF transporter S component [Lacticaseibacillus songhuajiangensis]|nr:folate family ECF transporter S component [Lacticaseibacillus songhuajiangensis]